MVRLFKNQIICIWKNYHPSPNHNKGCKTGPKRPGWLEWGYKKAGWVRVNINTYLFKWTDRTFFLFLFKEFV